MDIYGGVNDQSYKLFASKENKYVIDKAKEGISVITKYIGVAKEKLIESIKHIEDSKGNKLVDYL